MFDSLPQVTNYCCLIMHSSLVIAHGIVPFGKSLFLYLQRGRSSVPVCSLFVPLLLWAQLTALIEDNFRNKACMGCAEPVT